MIYHSRMIVCVAYCWVRHGSRLEIVRTRFRGADVRMKWSCTPDAHFLRPWPNNWCTLLTSGIVSIDVRPHSATMLCDHTLRHSKVKSTWKVQAYRHPSQHKQLLNDFLHNLVREEFEFKNPEMILLSTSLLQIKEMSVCIEMVLYMRCLANIVIQCHEASESSFSKDRLEVTSQKSYQDIYSML